jgi:hypothetical protein
VNKTPDNALVFTSKTDTGQPGIIVFKEASPTDENLLGIALAANLNTVSDDLEKFTSSIALTYTNKDLALYLSLDAFRRTLSVTSASLKSNTATSELLSFSTGYLIEGDSIKFDQPLTGTILGNSISIRSIRLGDLSESSISACAEPITIHGVSGVTSAGDPVVLETSLLDLSGSSFTQLADVYYAPPQNVFDNGQSMFDQLPQDIPGAQLMQLYYDYDPGDGSSFYAVGFFILNPDETTTFLLREFTPVLDDNNIVFNFAADISVFGNIGSPANTDAVKASINAYLDALSSGGSTYVFKIQEHVYEFFNPCTGWTFVFVNPDQ